MSFTICMSILWYLREVSRGLAWSCEVSRGPRNHTFGRKITRTNRSKFVTSIIDNQQGLIINEENPEP